MPLSGLRLGIWQGMPFEGADATVMAAWSAATDRLGKAGARLSDEKISLVDDMAQVNAKGGFSPAEAYAIHQKAPDIEAVALRLETPAHIVRAAIYLARQEAGNEAVQQDGGGPGE